MHGERNPGSTGLQQLNAALHVGVGDAMTAAGARVSLAALVIAQVSLGLWQPI
jgi:hypothetical protein